MKTLYRGAVMPFVEYKVEGETLTRNTKDWKGKVIILDFWGISCTSCIQMMPKLAAIEEKYYADVKVIAITKDSEESVKRLFGKLKMKRPVFSFVNADSLFTHLFRYVSIPHYVIIDKKGKVHSITYARNITEENIAKIKDGEPLSLAVKNDLEDFDHLAPLVKEGRGRLLQNSLQYSVLLGRLDGYSGRQLVLLKDPTLQQARIKIINASLLDMYRFAYGKSIFSEFRYDNRIIAMTRDSSKLFFPVDVREWDNWLMENTFCLELTVPLQDMDRIFGYFRSDLERYFPYEVSVEERKLCGYVLKEKKNFTMDTLAPGKNYEVNNFLLLINTMFSRTYPPIIADRSKGKVYFEELSKFKNFEEIRQRLPRYGFELVETELELDMLVIRDIKR